jgi:hypothetical protein
MYKKDAVNDTIIPIVLCVKSLMHKHECCGCCYFGKCADPNREMQAYGNQIILTNHNNIGV